MSTRTAEVILPELCIEDIGQLPSNDQKELARQAELLRNAFTIPEVMTSEERLKVVQSVLTKIQEICQGGGTVDDHIQAFKGYQNEVLDQSKYSFLGQRHPWLNMTWWGVFHGVIDPLGRGRNLHRVAVERGASGKRG